MAHRPPSASRRIQEALQLFQELQNAPIADIDDGDRLRGSSAPHSTQKPSNDHHNAMALAKKPHAPGAKHPPPHLEELKHKLQVADAIMKRLHKKNQELVTQIEAMKASGGVPIKSREDAEGAAAADDVQRLRRDCALRDKEIQQLKEQLRSAANHEAQHDVKAKLTSSPRPVADKATTKEEKPKGAPQASPAKDAIQGSRSRVLAQLHEAERTKWSAQYNEIVNVKLECIAQGEATGKVNKEVKAFFTALKQKVMDDAVHYEVQRAAMNEALFDAEMKLASLAS